MASHQIPVFQPDDDDEVNAGVKSRLNENYSSQFNSTYSTFRIIVSVLYEWQMTYPQKAFQ